MTVKELIEELSYVDQDAEVKFVYNYGDYWRTDVAADIDTVTEGEVVYSSYHRMDKVVDPDDDRYEGEEFKRVIIIK
jgi:hypothetical protein